MTNEVFLDTAFAIALVIRSDSLHSAAVDLAHRIRAQRIRMVTTEPVVFELANALAKVHLRELAVALIDGSGTAATSRFWRFPANCSTSPSPCTGIGQTRPGA